MTWAASTHLREILSNTLAVAFPLDDDTEEQLSERVNYATHELRRYLDWQEGWRPTGVGNNLARYDRISAIDFHHEFESAAKRYGKSCSESWDGDRFDWERYVNLLEDKLLTLVNKPLKGAR